jgi:putative ABC transport system substrate-binding protein
LALSSLAPTGFAWAQPRSKPHVIGLLHSESLAAIPQRIAALRRGLGEFGYVEGRNAAIEFRWAEGHEDRLQALAAELVRLPVDVIVTTATEPVLAAKHATSTVPIVFATVGDAVATGVVSSLARPGGNATGSTFFNPELMAKRLELAKRALAHVERIGVLLNPDSPLNTPILEAMERTARSLQVALHRFDVSSADQLEDTFASMARQGVQAMVMHDHPRFIASRKIIAALSLRQSIAAVGYGELVDEGGLLGYGVDFTALWHRAAYFVDRIFRGARPEELPVEQATRFDLAINLKTARQLGLAIPASVIVGADRVIE